MWLGRTGMITACAPVSVARCLSLSTTVGNPVVVMVAEAGIVAEAQP